MSRDGLDSGSKRKTKWQAQKSWGQINWALRWKTSSTQEAQHVYSIQLDKDMRFLLTAELRRKASHYRAESKWDSLISVRKQPSGLRGKRYGGYFLHTLSTFHMWTRGRLCHPSGPSPGVCLPFPHGSEAHQQQTPTQTFTHSRLLPAPTVSFVMLVYY